MMNSLELFLLLLTGHALCDYPLQGDFLAQTKSRAHKLNKIIPGLWIHSLTSHAIIHGGAVGLITGVWELGVAEAICHWIIDMIKCENKISLHTDQAFHIACKILWVFIMGLQII